MGRKATSVSGWGRPCRPGSTRCQSQDQGTEVSRRQMSRFRMDEMSGFWGVDLLDLQWGELFSELIYSNKEGGMGLVPPPQSCPLPKDKWRKADHSALKPAKFFPRATFRFSLKRPEIGGPVPLLPFLSSGAEPVFQLLPQAVIKADGLLQVLAQVPDSTKMLL